MTLKRAMQRARRAARRDKQGQFIISASCDTGREYGFGNGNELARAPFPYVMLALVKVDGEILANGRA